jgi:hypothetical protein
MNYVKKPRQHYGVVYVSCLVHRQNLSDGDCAINMSDYLSSYFTYPTATN